MLKVCYIHRPIETDPQNHEPWNQCPAKGIQFFFEIHSWSLTSKTILDVRKAQIPGIHRFSRP